MNGFAVYGQADWCSACGNSTGTCSPEALGTSTTTSGSGSSGNGNGDSSTGSCSCGNHMSLAVAGVIGAMVTLAVIGIVEAAVLFLGGLTIVSKRRSMGARSQYAEIELTGKGSS